MNASDRSAVFIQARSNSSRLRGKIYAPIPAEGSKSQLEHIYERMQRLDVAVVSILIPESDLLLIDWCQKKGLEYFCGSELDVRNRYQQAARHYNARWIVRATGDNPCVDVDIAAESLAMIRNRGLDLFSYNNLPLGMAVEVFQRKALFAQIPHEYDQYREHVSVHIKSNPHMFHFEHHNHPIMDQFSGIEAPRMTVDTPQDLQVVRQVFRELGYFFGVKDVMQLYSERPELFGANQDVIQKTIALH